MKKFYSITNLLILILTIFWSYYINSGQISENTVGSISNKYYSLIAPASYAFSIWGIIYLGLIANSLYQLKRVFFGKKNSEFVNQIGPWLILTNLLSIFWIWFWVNDNIGFSVFFMFAMLISLVIIILRLNMEKWDAPLPTIALIWWPVCLYSGWITVASISNVAAWLISIEWAGLSHQVFWTIVMLIIALGINLMMIVFRNMREFALVGVWAFIAISYKHWESIKEIQWTALIAAIVLLVVIGIHGYKNRKTNPFLRTKF